MSREPLSPGTPSGWYPDPANPTLALYWTGTSWHGKPRKGMNPRDPETAREEASRAVQVRERAEEVEAQIQAIPVTTAFELSGFRVVGHCAEVFGLTVRSRNFLSDFGAGMRSVLGGEVEGYTKMLREAREESLLRLRQEAARAGGNAVIAMGLAATQIADMTELLAYGTAVLIEPASPGRASPAEQE